MNNNIIRLGITAAAVVLVVILGISFLPGPNLGSDPTPQPTPEPTPELLLEGTLLDPGTYAIRRYFTPEFDLTVTDTWETWGADSDVVRIWKPCKPGVCTGYSAILTFEIVRQTFSDPCHAILDPQQGGSVNDLVDALTNLPAFKAGPVTDVSVDGYAGKSFELTFIGNGGEICVDGGDWQWLSSSDAVADRVGWGTVAQQRVIVLDVDGTRLVADAITYPPHSDGLELDAIIDSIDFH